MTVRRLALALAALVLPVVGLAVVELAAAPPADAHRLYTAHVTGKGLRPNGRPTVFTVFLERLDDTGAVVDSYQEDFSGGWGMRVKAGRYRVHFVHRWGNSPLADGWWPQARSQTKAGMLVVERGDRVRGISHTFGKRGALRGKVTYSGPGELADGYVAAERVGDGLHRSTHFVAENRSASFTLQGLAPGTWELSVGPSASQTSPYPPTRVRVRAGRTTRGVVVPAIPGAVVSGTVTDPAGAAVPGAEVDALREHRGSWRFLGSTTTDETGSYVLTGLAGASYHLQVSAPWSTSDLWGLATVPIVLPDAGSRRVDVVLPPASSATGVVTDSQGRPVEGAQVSFIHDLRGGGTTTDATGHYTVPRLTEATYRVLVRPPAGSDLLPVQIDGVKVPVGRLELDLPLGLGGSVSGVVTLSDGSPADAYLTIYRWRDGDWYHQATTRTDPATGRYTLRVLPPGTYRLRTSRHLPGTQPVVDAEEYYPDVHSIDRALSIVVGLGDVLTGYDVMSGDDGPSVINLSPPSISGVKRVGELLMAGPGTWSHAATFGYAWRDEEGLLLGRQRSLRLRPRHLGARITVEVTASAPGWTDGYAVSSPTSPITKVTR